MTLRILGIDPGGTTGWATFTAEERYDPVVKKMRYDHIKWECGQIADDKHEHHEELDDLMGLMQTDHFIIVCESFEYRNRLPKAELISRNYIGVVELFAKRRMQRTGQLLVMQTASMGKVRKTGFVKDRNLKRLGLWSPGHPHAMDGYGHVLYYMINNGNILKNELLEKGWKE